jgi:hypothetical protein
LLRRPIYERHHWLLVGAAATFLAGWLLWNVLVVEEDLSTPAAMAPGTARP